MTSPQTDARVRRLQRHPWNRSFATALGGGILIDATIVGGKIDPAGQLRGGTWFPVAAR
jgi:hypothetical protein